MNDSSDLRQLLLAYNLGELPSAERSELEERMFNDEVFSDRLEEAEYDLIDDYRAHRLRTADRPRIEKVFSREQLMRALLPATSPIQRHPESRAAHQPIQQPANVSLSTSAWPRFRLPLAAAVLGLLAATSWLLVSRHVQERASNYVAATSGTNAPASPPAVSGNNTPSSHTLPNPAATAVLLLGPEITRGAPTVELQLSPEVSALRAVDGSAAGERNDVLPERDEERQSSQNSNAAR